MAEHNPMEVVATWSAYLRERKIRLYRPIGTVPRTSDADARVAAPAAGPPVAMAGPPPARRETLDAIRLEMGDCRRCKLAAGRTKLVFGDGNPAARLMFVGEGPGADEDRTGIPFVGKAGQLLNKMIAAMGLKRQDVYIANIVKSRPPGNRDPEPDEVAACLPFLQRQIRAVAPEVLVTLGRPAARGLLGFDGPISAYRGTWQTWEGIAVMPTFHPAYLLRNPAAKADAWKDLQQVMARLGLSTVRGG
jgi:DNA polymerase